MYINEQKVSIVIVVDYIIICPQICNIRNFSLLLHKNIL